MGSRARKPPELLHLRSGIDQLFYVLRQQFRVPALYELDLEHVEADLRHPLDLAAYAMWQAQHLHHLTSHGVVATSEAVITTCSQLAHHLELLAAEAVDAEGQDIMLRARQDLFVAARVVVALDGTIDGPPIELY